MLTVHMSFTLIQNLKTKKIIILDKMNIYELPFKRVPFLTNMTTPYKQVYVCSSIASPEDN